jgi:hypothetical protein
MALRLGMIVPVWAAVILIEILSTPEIQRPSVISLVIINAFAIPTLLAIGIMIYRRPSYSVIVAAVIATSSSALWTWNDLRGMPGPGLGDGQADIVWYDAPIVLGIGFTVLAPVLRWTEERFLRPSAPGSER